MACSLAVELRGDALDIRGKWYNMQYINMSGNLPMGIAGNALRVRYSAAYPTGAERIAKGTPLPWGSNSIVLLYQ